MAKIDRNENSKNKMREIQTIDCRLQTLFLEKCVKNAIKNCSSKMQCRIQRSQ